jgi:hypothetical protein
MLAAGGCPPVGCATGGTAKTSPAGESRGNGPLFTDSFIVSRGGHSMKRRTVHLLGLVLSCLLSAGCVDMENPLAAPGDVEPDGRLTGLWLQEAQEADESGDHYHIGPVGGQAPASLMRVIHVSQNKKGALEQPKQLLLFPCEIEGQGYLNVVGAPAEQIASIKEDGWQPELFDSYLLMTYRLDDDTLLARGMKGKAIREAIEAGKLDGKVEQREHFWQAHVTASTDELAEFVSARGEELFADESVRLKRVR